jgi:tetratricopeptide (TPR) repeat protein
MPTNTVHPPELAETLAALRVHPDHILPAMVEPFIPLASEIDQETDKRLALFLRTLAECMSIQSAANWLLLHETWDVFCVYFEAVDHFCHGFMRYHPPRQPWIGSRDFELYHNVVSMAYQLHDEMLGSLMQKAGDDTVVMLISDHGFHPDHLRPSSIPDIPAGPAIEHRDYGVFAVSGPGIRKGQVVYGPSLLDVTPTILATLGLPVAEDMDGKVLSPIFEEPPQLEYIASWEDVAGADGRHPPRAHFDPVAAHEAMEQMIALGYIERPDKNSGPATEATVRDLRYNLGEAYQDDGRHTEAYEIFRELHSAHPDEQRFAVRLFVSCQALGYHQEMRRIVDDLDGRRREPARFEPSVIDYLKTQILIAERRYTDALAMLECITETNVNQPALYLQAGDLCLRLRHNAEAQRNYEATLSIDPDNARASMGLSRIALRRRDYPAAAHLALDALQRTYQNPVAHFLLGRALAAIKEHERAADAFRAAISLNPNFPQAHSRLAALLETHLSDPESAREHRRLARSMRSAASRPAEIVEPAPIFSRPTTRSLAVADADMPPTSESVVVVTGLPRAGTSLVMQMLAAGGMEVLSDELRQADEDNPRGYLEYQPVRNLLKDSSWLFEARGKAIKIVAPLLVALPSGLACLAILCERDLDEVLDSQERMLRCRNSPGRRRMLKDEYLRTLDRVKAMLAARPHTQTLIVDYAAAVSDSLSAAERICDFVGTPLDIVKMAAAIDPALYRNRRGRA